MKHEVLGQKILAIILARGGSKGIPKKNIIFLAGKPLIAWTIEAAKKSKFITATLVSSDNEEILKVAQSFGAETLKRPKILATDNAMPEHGIIHAIKSFQKQNKYMPDIVVLLQPTSPLRTGRHIDEAISLMLEKKCNAVISVTEIKKSYLKTFMIRNGYLSGVANDDFPFMRRQKLPNIYMANGAIYAILTQKFIKKGKLLIDKTLPYVMDEECSMDLDYPEDIPLLEKKLFNKNR